MLIVFCNFMKNYYQILEIQAGAPKEVIKAAYRALVKKYHPDNYSGDINVANEKLRELSEAYEVLVDESKRREYDKQSTNVTYELQKMWGVSIEDLWNAGMENLQKEGVAILSIEEITHGLLPEDGLGMYAMTTENMLRGSVSVLSEEVLKKFSEEKKADYYLLPRSIYEWILIEKTDDLDPVYTVEDIRFADIINRSTGRARMDIGYGK